MAKDGTRFALSRSSPDNRRCKVWMSSILETRLGLVTGDCLCDVGWWLIRFALPVCGLLLGLRFVGTANGCIDSITVDNGRGCTVPRRSALVLEPETRFDRCQLAVLPLAKTCEFCAKEARADPSLRVALEQAK
eukprot:TRINITY_DN11983_c0_g2_i1.p2 TRINITY_DN11983_c0_g2~~TRINITY_DN11983_c0_g2_i1.p2  ORF type:complete len:134 (-),score=7.30 TRINITY_DN11983_c0_g2_i1:2455-2856(-)